MSRSPYDAVELLLAYLTPRSGLERDRWLQRDTVREAELLAASPVDLGDAHE